MDTIKKRAVTLGTLILFFFAIGSAGAQEKVGVATGPETAQVAENVEAQTMAVTVEKLIAKWAMEKALRKHEEIEVMKEPVMEGVAVEKALASPQDFTLTPGQPINQQNSWNTGLSMCDDGLNLCGITFDSTRYPLVGGKPSPDVLSIVQSGWSTTADGEEIGDSGITVHRRE